MEPLSKEELAELEQLEKDEDAKRKADAIAVQRQHLDALRLRKTLATKHGVHERDFLVLETTVGNIAIRRPVDVEIDGIDENSDRAAIEKFASAIVIHPDAATFQRLMSEHHGVAGTIVTQSMRMLKVIRQEETKK